ncbi:MAG TPA: beta-N-acetylhexosaminidase [Mucilaginibacter sp.]|jgi:hexosaminidase|nr:beta-N-acetylhexosaminidase [Mucilaginibacter sp.]
MKFFSLAIFLLLSQFLYAQDVNLIPYPQSYARKAGVFHLDSTAIIGMNDNSLLPQANYLQTELQRTNSIAIAVDPNEANATIDFKLIKDTRPDGAYTLTIQPNKITITAAGNDGLFYGIVSLLQLIRSQQTGANLQACEITDAPRYQWRGLMLDESRHFFGKEKIEQLLNWMAFYKLNKFHWHLTDDDGWRLEIKKYPLLASIGGIGNHTAPHAPAKYYTQDDIKDIVAYAQDRFITIIPEVDMPGHATAATRAYPEFSGGSIPGYENYTFDPANEKTYQFLSDILKEVNTLFPAHMIHLGGDEVALGIQAWAGRPGISDIITTNKFTQLTDVEHLFFNRMADTVNRLGDKVLCWDEAASTDLTPAKTIVFWWRQNVPSQLELALQKRYHIVLCPRLPMYLDFVQDKTHISGRRWNGQFFNPLNEIYNFPDEQLPQDQLQSDLLMGIQANLWTETVESNKRLDFMIFPRMAALAESAWTSPASKNETSFDQRLKTNFAWYDKEGIYYFNPFEPAAHPEAIDFRPIVPKQSPKSRHHRHGPAAYHHKSPDKHKPLTHHSKKSEHREE